MASEWHWGDHSTRSEGYEIVVDYDSGGSTQHRPLPPESDRSQDLTPRPVKLPKEEADERRNRA
jgi:hypothetical protein